MEYPYSRQPQPNIPYDPIRSNSNVGHYLTVLLYNHDKRRVKLI